MASFAAVVTLMAGFHLPSFSAVPVTHVFNETETHLFFGSNGSGGQGASIAASWNPPPSLDPLESIMVHVTFTSQISVRNPNPLGFPLNNTFINWRPEVFVALPDGTSAFAFGSTQHVFATGTGTVTASGLFSDTLHLNFGLPVVVGGNPLAIDLRTNVDAGTQFGDGVHTGTFLATVTYNVPESGWTALWLAPVMMVLLAGKKSRPDWWRRPPD